MKTTLMRQACTVAFAAAALSLSTPTPVFAQGNGKGKGQQISQSNGNGKNGIDRPSNQRGPKQGTAPVPEPATWISMGTLALLAAAFARRQLKLKREANSATRA